MHLKGYPQYPVPSGQPPILPGGPGETGSIQRGSFYPYGHVWFPCEGLLSYRTGKHGEITVQGQDLPGCRINRLLHKGAVNTVLKTPVEKSCPEDLPDYYFSS